MKFKKGRDEIYPLIAPFLRDSVVTDKPSGDKTDTDGDKVEDTGAQ